MSKIEMFSNARLLSSVAARRRAEPQTEPRRDSSSRIVWTLQRSNDSARCVLCAVGDRVELHITMTHDVVMSQQCAGRDQAAAISNAWWMALVKRGWVGHDAPVTIRPKPDRRASQTR